MKTLEEFYQEAEKALEDFNPIDMPRVKFALPWHLYNTLQRDYVEYVYDFKTKKWILQTDGLHFNLN